ncbi:Outer membrane protein beta-barrel domain-containing protein [Chryseolinea serpens]|uniref:Outer membrane protein beta-barrel domain-containing protein n=1 Tax=Chryseolinea serpens TaxID=947013 RepID=A0A1M5SIR1_9BACT|nr:porin family protein [Chryseolinea serpens]SHH38158.1 Outer membrane protein beta-barrel domain-containing protein [Chryseolinea serpens]
MRKVTDNELDKIFREAADRNEPEFDPKDWEDMAKRLDQDDKAALARSKTLYTVVALLVISTLWPQFDGKDKTQTASVMKPPAATELKDENLKEGNPASTGDPSTKDAASASKNEETMTEGAPASEKDLTIKRETAASEKSQLVKEEVLASGKGQTAKKEVSAGGVDQTVEQRIPVTKESRPLPSTKRNATATNALTSPTPAQENLSSSKAKAGLGRGNAGLIKAESNHAPSAVAGAIVSGQASKNITSATPVDQEQNQASPAVVKESSGLSMEPSNVERDAATKKDGTTAISKPAQGIVMENNVANDKEISDKTLRKEQSIMGEAAAAGNDRLPSSANGEIILMNDGQSQLQVQPQSPPIILLEGIPETKKDGSPGIAAPSESKASGNEETSATANLTAQPAEHAGASAKDSTQQAEKNIAPVQTAADSGTVQKDWKDEKQAVSHSWFVKLPVSPDFSSINYTTPGKPGINIGLLGEYSLSRHFSVSTGAIYSKKLYDSKNPDKSYSSGGWTAKAKSLNGDCRVLDIPINVTYYIFPESKTSLFVTLGSSSYIMLKEKYVYTVWANQRDYQYEENFSHKNNEWFSMLNISIGVQRRIGEHFFVQAEPFLKAPMSGVGEGKVNLVSTGVFFSLKYKLGK